MPNLPLHKNSYGLNSTTAKGIKEVQNIPKSISPKMNVLIQLEFELVYSLTRLPVRYGDSRTVVEHVEKSNLLYITQPSMSVC